MEENDIIIEEVTVTPFGFGNWGGAGGGCGVGCLGAGCGGSSNGIGCGFACFGVGCGVGGC